MCGYISPYSFREIICTLKNYPISYGDVSLFASLCKRYSFSLFVITLLKAYTRVYMPMAYRKNCCGMSSKALTPPTFSLNYIIFTRRWQAGQRRHVLTGRRLLEFASNVGKECIYDFLWLWCYRRMDRFLRSRCSEWRLQLILSFLPSCP